MGNLSTVHLKICLKNVNGFCETPVIHLTLISHDYELNVDKEKKILSFLRLKTQIHFKNSKSNVWSQHFLGSSLEAWFYWLMLMLLHMLLVCVKELPWSDLVSVYFSAMKATCCRGIVSLIFNFSLFFVSLVKCV